MYDPATEVWTSLPSNGAPAPRYEPFVVCTPGGFFVWGGRDAADAALITGGAFDAASGKWSAISSRGAPSARSSSRSRGGWGVFTGQRMALIGGLGSDGQPTLDGGSYDPATDSWTAFPPWPSGSLHEGGAAAYTGLELLLWSGTNGAGATSDGDRLHP